MNFDPITYNEAAQLRAHFLLLNGDPAALKYLLAAGITGPGLQAWLATQANLTAFQQLLSAPSGAAAIGASGTAMAAVAASSTAMAAVAASSTAMAAVIASSTAMAAVAASSTAMAAVAASATAMAAVAASATAMAAVAASSTAMAAVLGTASARRAVYDFDTAWNFITASGVAKGRLRAIELEASTTSVSHVYPPNVSGNTRVAFLQQATAHSVYPCYAGASADTYSTSSMTWIDRFVRVTGFSHRGTSGAGSRVRYVVME